MEKSMIIYAKTATNLNLIDPICMLLNFYIQEFARQSGCFLPANFVYLLQLLFLLLQNIMPTSYKNILATTIPSVNECGQLLHLSICIILKELCQQLDHLSKGSATLTL